MSLIVVVDDRATNRAIYCKLALSIGQDIEVKDFGDPQQALAWLANRRPNLIVTDYDMPQMNGEEFISRFRQLPHAAAVPIIMITVCDQRVLRLRALESGATDFLNTPVDHCEFLMRARNLLNLRQASVDAMGEEGLETRSRKAERSPGPRKTRDIAAKPNPSPLATPPPKRPMRAAAWNRELQGELLALRHSQGCALHVIDIEQAAPGSPHGPAGDLAGVEAALLAQLRGGDRLRRIGERRFAVLQQSVVDPGDATACARRLRALQAPGVAIYIGTAQGVASQAGAQVFQRAALADLARDRESGAAWTVVEKPGSAPAVPAPWRFLPQIDLVSGLMAGAQMSPCAPGSRTSLASASEVTNEAALRGAIVLARAIASLTPNSSGSRPFRVSLRAPLVCEGGAPMALRIAATLAESRANPALLDIEADGLDLIENAARAEMDMRQLKELGVHVTLDLGGLAGLDLWTAPDIWRAPALRCCDRIKIDCRGANDAAVDHLGRTIAAWSADRALPVLAGGVSASALLSPLRRAGVCQAQGPCFGAPFSGDKLFSLLIPARRTAPRGVSPEPWAAGADPARA